MGLRPCQGHIIRSYHILFICEVFAVNDKVTPAFNYSPMQDAHHSFIDDSEIIVDYNRQQLMPGWIPRRLGQSKFLFR